MRAIEFSEFGAASVLQLADLPEPAVRPHDLLVRVRAAGVNRADVLHREGHYGRSDFGDSTLMGLEIAGEVVGMGSEVRQWRLGDRVMGIVGGGAYAEFARIDYRMALAIPGGIDYVQAAAIPEVFVTAHEALVHLGRLVAGESVLIHAAASGVGSAAVQLAKACGAKVFATAKSAKLDRVRELGADVGIDYTTTDFAEAIKEATDGNGVDLIIDFIGAPYFNRNLASLDFGGRLVQVGLLGGSTPPEIDLQRLLYRHLHIFGTVMKSRPQAEKQAMTKRFRDTWLDHFSNGELRAVVDSVFPLEKAAEAHERMESNESVGKIVLTP
ncbi:NAD(P)H-quinone oxidoreductase [Luteibacter aegosomaticola]|uniref:NAD(P)H-quinone oxidoreductase n=1 Tax=Luteibacter aegosomaticola TaxID=2911538 RepID=UPI001FF74060|nr:NAD(P)H-quinone oxidoreductase [Luteibacter aegosomaticola]UPG90023.1 NAD(P)H-quinone oxidoreductase [Luteibacter aegosomaticola]